MLYNEVKISNYTNNDSLILITLLFPAFLWYVFQRPLTSSSDQITGAQEWHIVSLLGDVTSPTTVAHYVSMMSHLRVLSTEKH